MSFLVSSAKCLERREPEGQKPSMWLLDQGRTELLYPSQRACRQWMRKALEVLGLGHPWPSWSETTRGSSWHPGKSWGGKGGAKVKNTAGLHRGESASLSGFCLPPKKERFWFSISSPNSCWYCVVFRVLLAVDTGHFQPWLLTHLPASPLPSPPQLTHFYSSSKFPFLIFSCQRERILFCAFKVLVFLNNYSTLNTYSLIIYKFVSPQCYFRVLIPPSTCH